MKAAQASQQVGRERIHHGVVGRAALGGVGLGRAPGDQGRVAGAQLQDPARAQVAQEGVQDLCVQRTVEAVVEVEAELVTGRIQRRRPFGQVRFQALLHQLELLLDAELDPRHRRPAGEG